MGIANSIATFLAETPVSAVGEAQRERACDAFCDTLAVGAAGSRTENVSLLVDSIPAIRAARVWSESRSAVIGKNFRLTSEIAALVNGTAMHALDFDDIAHPAYAHPTAVVLPALLSMCADAEISGPRALAAHVISIEVINRLGSLVNLDHYRAGWHATSTLGTLAATAAAAYAIELDRESTLRALSIAASMASGLRANFGTMTKPLHAGLAARNAVEAVHLGRSGFTASEDAISLQNGFLAALSTVDPETAEFFPPKDGVWEIDLPVGLALKAFPSCGGTHSAIEAAMLIRERNGELPVGVRVGVNRLMPAVLVHRRPSTGLQGKFSMEYCIASTFLNGQPRLRDFEDAAVQKVVSSDFFPRVTMHIDDRIADEPEPAAIVEVAFADGRRDAETVMISRGKGSRWMTREEQRSKFDSCLEECEGLLADPIWDTARGLMEDTSLNQLEATLSTH